MKNEKVLGNLMLCPNRNKCSVGNEDLGTCGHASPHQKRKECQLKVPYGSLSDNPKWPLTWYCGDCKKIGPNKNRYQILKESKNDV
jgi:hypothetical protein